MKSPEATQYLDANGRHLYLVPQSMSEGRDDNRLRISPDGPDHENFHLFLEDGYLYLGTIST